ncbi:hypothetical protein [Streptomyces sp. ME19-01-6]|uniref:hypothetical protein n=1 Tax=Streptomyces sp. ME19-01-6 TaxID=3028686 RepID=UPI0029B7CD36|nr:hypothetical protein [Streptomyces sp. ME19-01-6]MDX3224786.1 hypothetical protein [Streptomyces sp. ME19-01-6]
MRQLRLNAQFVTAGPVCRSDDEAAIAGCRLLLKGGQVGPVDVGGTETGALLESAGVAVHAVQRAGYAVAGRGVIVSGAGPVGMVVARLAHLMGAAYVIVWSPTPSVAPRPNASVSSRWSPERRSSSAAAN